ncbi:hypothetical protein INT45_011545 [Circinella minor]|uniref:Ndc10 domain-containing protein n=1 Tax=Circinella minor TaxID=1195481 RepID=A0A8H7S453_9FUNG|nr:hypothetical protein INT45_011545 [Circinella minor]
MPRPQKQQRQRRQNNAAGSSTKREDIDQAQLEQQLEDAVVHTNEMAKSLQPKATKSAYKPKQKEFKEWCKEKGFSRITQYQVTGKKLNLFLQEKVLGRERRTPGRRKRNAEEMENEELSDSSGDSDGDGNGDQELHLENDDEEEMDQVENLSPQEQESIRLIGFSTIDQYVSAITALYNEQLTAGVNVMENQPRINAVKNLLKNARILDRQKRCDNYEDRAAGTIFDGYSTTEKLAQVVDYFLRKDRSEHYRNAMMLLLSHHCLLRGENVRSLDLPDAQTLSLEGEGVTPDIECQALVILIDHGKTNKFGKPQYGSCIQNDDIKTCPWMMLALYLFHRWIVVQEPFLNMTKPESWYNIKLYKGDNVDNTKEMQPKAHYDAIEKGFKACHIRSMAKTHAGQQSGAKMADIRGAGESDIRRAGRWTNDALESAYLTNLPRALLRVMAGFHKDGGRFYLRRAIEKPDPKLCRKVFPMVEVWQERINRGREHGDQSITADGFLQMLRQLSVVFLQDSVPLQELYPRLSI